MVEGEKQPARQFVLGVDLDGVVADFYPGLRPIAAEWLGVAADQLPLEVSYGLGEWGLDALGGYEDLHRFAVTQRELFRKLTPMPGAPAALRRISQNDVRIRIITHRLYVKYFHQEAVTQTTAWLEHHGIPYWDLCFMKDKAAVGADLYVEDSPANVEALRADGHETIVFRNSTNRQIAAPAAATWAEVEELVADRQRRWRESGDGRGVPGR
jgi:5'(3')-deoxyribonucleotidase